jgi:hypothetical protein
MEAKLSGTVNGAITYNGVEIAYTASVSGTYWEDKGDYWTPPSADSEGPFFEETDEVIAEDGIYEQHQAEIDQLIKDDIENNKSWDDCNWDWDQADEDRYPDPPEED